MDIRESLEAAFGPDRVRVNALLAGYTAFRIGGAAEFLVETRGADQVERGNGGWSRYRGGLCGVPGGFTIFGGSLGGVTGSSVGRSSRVEPASFATRNGRRSASVRSRTLMM